MTEISDAERAKLKTFQGFKDELDRELNFREISGKANEYEEYSTEDLKHDRDWYSKAMDEIIAPYEVG